MRWRSAFVAVACINAACLTGTAGASQLPDHKTFAVVPTNRWAGYYESKPAIRSAVATWRVPTLHCGAGSTLSSTWVGVGGVDGSVLLQAGLFDNCVSGVAENGGFAEAYPGSTHSFGILMRAGDKITATVANVGGTWQARVTDDTTKQSEVASASGYKGGGTAEWMAEAYGEPTYPLSNFGSEKLIRFSVDGLRAKPEQAWSMTGSAGTVNPTNPAHGYRLIYG